MRHNTQPMDPIISNSCMQECQAFHCCLWKQLSFVHSYRGRRADGRHFLKTGVRKVEKIHYQEGKKK